MSTSTTRSFDAADPAREIADFVSAVRRHLDDLSADEVAELTGGLEADLTDALAEASATPSEQYGDPEKYAGELRAAAGLPPRDASGGWRDETKPGFADGVEQSFIVPLRERYESGVRQLDAQPWWPGVRDFLVVLRPAWWVIRAWVAVQMLMVISGVGDSSAVRGGFGGLVLLLVAIVISVQLGRNTPLPATWQRLGIAAGNVLAVLLLLPMMFTTVDNRYENSYSESYPAEQTGLSLNGESLENVFPYDAEGRPLSGIQLFDQQGRPLEIAENSRSFYDDRTGSSGELVPGSPDGSAPRWNSFPLKQRVQDDSTGELGPVVPVPLPLSGVPSAATPTSTDGPTAGASPTATASASEPDSEPTATETAEKSKGGKG